MYTKNKVIIFGTLDLAELAHYYLTNDREYEVVAFTVNKEYIKNGKFKPRGSEITYDVVPFENLEELYPTNEYLFFAPLSGAKMNKYILKENERGINIFHMYHLKSHYSIIR